MIALLIFGNSISYLANIRGGATNIINDAVAIVDIAPTKISDLYENIKNLSSVYDQNIQLKQQNSLLRYDIQKLEALEYENRQLKKQVNLVEGEEFSYITAKVISNIVGPYNYYATILAGADHGVKEGQIVVNNQGLVGKIIKVYEKTSSLLLVTDLNSKIPVITSSFLEKAIIAGSNNNSLKLLYLSDNRKIETGETVATKDDGGSIPIGIPVATIESINGNYITAKPVVDFNKLDYVRVLINN